MTTSLCLEVGRSKCICQMRRLTKSGSQHGSRCHACVGEQGVANDNNKMRLTYIRLEGGRLLLNIVTLYFEHIVMEVEDDGMEGMPKKF